MARKQSRSCLLWKPLKVAKKAPANASQKGCQQAYITQLGAALLDFLLQSH